MKRLSRAIAICLVAVCLSGCGSGDDDDGGAGGRAPVAVLSAFPAELAAVLERMEIDGTLAVMGRTFRTGTLGGVRVIAGMTGIGLVNAATTTAALLDQYEVSGVVVSGVAGSPARIGDVTVPEAWQLVGESTYATDPTWLAVASAIASADEVDFESCTVRPSAPDDPICLLHEPIIVVGGIGESSDPFGAMAVACTPNGGDVFGCDVDTTGGASAAARGETAVPAAAVDMESAAIAREAALRGLPFIAFRAVSDGEGDPLNLPGFPAQFFTYYRLAAHNAAAAAQAFVARVGT
jgi:nucleoside phosphorylase